MAKRALFLTVVVLATVISLVVVATASGQHQSSSGSGSGVGATLLQTPTPTATPMPEPTPDTVEVAVVQAPVEPFGGARGFALVMTAILIAGLGVLALLAFFAYGIYKESRAPALEPLGRLVIEGITLVTVIAALILLGIQGVIDSQGVIAVLSAIVGFVLGRNLAPPKAAPSPPPAPPAAPPSPSPPPGAPPGPSG